MPVLNTTKKNSVCSWHCPFRSRGKESFHQFFLYRRKEENKFRLVTIRISVCSLANEKFSVGNNGETYYVIIHGGTWNRDET